MKPLPTLGFASAAAFRRWLAKNHTVSEGLWLKISKKGSGEPSVTYAEALDEALCFGWIDGQRKANDEATYLQKFTPRRKRSIWSKINVGRVERLVAEGRMEAAGLLQVEEAKKDGRWQRAYDSPSSSEMPDDFLRELGKDEKAAAFFKTLNRANLYAISWRLQTARKPETRAARMRAILAMLGKGEKFH